MQAYDQSRSKRAWYALTPGDMLAGLSVALIALPQSLAYAELAGMPPHTGLYAVALGVLAASCFVSSPYLQAGPVATTSLLAFGVLSEVAVPGTAEYLAAAGLLAVLVGLVRVAVGLVRFGSLAYLMSQPVLLGFMSAAAVLIIASQIPTVLGVPVAGHEVLLGALVALSQVAVWDGMAIVLAGVTMAVIFLGKRLHPLFPGVLAAMLIGLAASLLLDYRGAVVGSIPKGLPTVQWRLPWAILPSLLVGSVVIALVGFAEAASIARTYATLERQRWNPHQEFISQGVANIAAGLFGGFPVGASFSRSAVNRLAGAKTRWSGAVTGLAVLAFLPFTPLVASLPRAVLGAIVIAAVSNLMRFPDLVRLRQYSRPQAYIGWLTFGLTLILAPHIDVAVLLGIGLAIAHHLRREQQVLYDSWSDNDRLHFKPQGVLWFGSMASVETACTDLLADHPEATKIVFHLGGLGRIDLSAALMLQRLMDDARQAGLEVELVEVPPMAKSWVARVWR